MEGLFLTHPAFTLAAALFAACVLATIGVGAILAYHLFKFSLTIVQPIMGIIVYSTISFLLFSLMFTTLFYI